MAKKSHKIHDAWEKFKKDADEFFNGPHAPPKRAVPAKKKAAKKKVAKKKARRC